MIIFDLDGTLADCEHRRHFVDPSKRSDVYFHDRETLHQGVGWYYKDKGDRTFEKHFEPDWQAFYEACDQDKPIIPVIQCFNNFADNFGSENIKIWSGRSESVRQKTIDWLLINVPCFHRDIILQMRPIGNHMCDELLKEKWLDKELRKVQLNNFNPAIQAHQVIQMVFDDRPKVVRMWQRRGIFVFNCCQHNNDF